MAARRPATAGAIVPILRRSMIGLSFVILAAAPVSAENVPLPIPAPLPKTGAAPSAAPAPAPAPKASVATPTQPAPAPKTAVAPPTPPAPAPKASAATQTPPAPAAPANASASAETHESSSFPFSLPFLKNLSNSDQGSNFDAKQRSLLDRISMYLSSVQTMEGNFVQVGPDGGRTEGNFYIQKPGRVRFAYNPPSPIDIIADGSSVVVRDRKLATQDLYPLSQTPLRYLLADRIDLLRDTDVVSVSSDETFATVVIEQKQALIGTARLMLMFDAKDLTLKQWTVTDPQGFDTTVAVYNLDSTIKPDPNLFVINYHRDQGGVQ
ncbi:MAG TPA: outer membrane lipoprotein carrier protein LolA [Xanthobacteraceae bacterium]|nr:outer membrane lipoprotein carrier protein LolA [Xanthobacteraceae bacterium]